MQIRLLNAFIFSAFRQFFGFVAAAPFSDPMKFGNGKEKRGERTLALKTTTPDMPVEKDHGILENVFSILFSTAMRSYIIDDLTPQAAVLSEELP
jgi:hypothetical protein